MVDKNKQPTEFSVTYAGDALDSNLMDVKDLAPALLSLGQAFERANTLLNGDKATVNLNIKALSPGSFGISLVLSQLLQNASIAPISWDWLTNANNLTALLIGVPGGTLSLVMLIKKLKGKKPKQTETKDCIIFEAENIKLTVPKGTARLYNDKSVREQIEGVMRPLLKSGINKVTFKQNKKEVAEVYNTEVKYFSLSDDKENVKEYIIPRQRLQIASLTFKGGKWCLSDGANTHWYSMDDKEFDLAIKHGKAFGMFHILICEVVMTQQLLPDGKLKLEYAVKKVLDHIVPGEQSRF